MENRHCKKFLPLNIHNQVAESQEDNKAVNETLNRPSDSLSSQTGLKVSVSIWNIVVIVRHLQCHPQEKLTRMRRELNSEDTAIMRQQMVRCSNRTLSPRQSHLKVYLISN